ncbi:MAG: hypothetical protein IPM91_02345 [Bacteroidetes bacterium]|nr:hypothetical protein [Bacteroidota bacterium]
MRRIYKKNASNAIVDLGAEIDIKLTMANFQEIGHSIGELFCKKAIVIILKNRYELSNNESHKLYYLNMAHDHINELIIEAKSSNWNTPSILKHQGEIKSELAKMLYQVGDRENAAALEGEANQIFKKMMIAYPDYVEGAIAFSKSNFKLMRHAYADMISTLELAYKYNLENAGKSSPMLKK